MSGYTGYVSKVECPMHEGDCTCVRCVGTINYPCCRAFCELSDVVRQHGMCISCYLCKEVPKEKVLVKKRYLRMKGPVY